MATAKPNYTAAAFRKLLAKLADLYRSGAEASIARVEAQIKEICDQVSPGPSLGPPSMGSSSGERFIHLFRNQWRSSGAAVEYSGQRDRILVWLDESAAEKRKPYAEKARQGKADKKAHRNRRMVDEHHRMEPSWDDSDTALMVSIGKRYGVKRTTAIEVITRGREARGQKPAKPRKA
jgi:hypothetical protein